MLVSLGAAAFAEGVGTEKTVPVYRESLTGDETVDFGVEPDYALTEEKDGEIDYSRFFDFAEISRLIDEYYGAQTSDLSNAA